MGSSLVEFALVVPILFTLLLGIFTFAIALNHYVTLTNAATMGAQTIATGRGQLTDPCASAVTAIQAAAPSLTSGSLTYYFAFNGGSLTSESTCGSQSLVEGQNMQVRVTYPCNLTIYNVNFAPSCTLTAQTSEAIE